MSGSSGIAVRFNEHEPRGIIDLLHDIKAGDAGFANARLSIVERGSFEVIDAFGLHLNVDVNNEHGMRV